MGSTYALLNSLPLDADDPKREEIHRFWRVWLGPIRGDGAAVYEEEPPVTIPGTDRKQLLRYLDNDHLPGWPHGKI